MPPSLEAASVVFSTIANNAQGNNSIQRVDDDGGNLEVLYGNLDYPIGMSHDTASGTIYWADPTDRAGVHNPRIMRGALDGSGIAIVAELDNYPGPATPQPTDVAFDVTTNTIYWGDVDTTLFLGGGQHLRSNVGSMSANGGNIGPAFIYDFPTDSELLGSPNPVAASQGSFYHMSRVQGGIYRNGNLANPVIQRAMGTVFQAFEIYELFDATGNLDVQRMFWIENNSLYSADMNGGDLSLLVNGIANGSDIAFDSEEGHIYWADDRRAQNGMSEIFRANLDGTDVESVIQGAWEITGLAIVPTPVPEPGVPSLLALVAAVNLLGRRRP